jgi:hypothetical protein
MMVASPSIFRATTARKGGPGLSNFFSMIILGMLIYVIFGSIIHSVCKIEIGSDAVNPDCGIMRFLRDMGDDLSFKGYEPHGYVYKSTGVTREGLTPKSDKPSTSGSDAGAKEKTSEDEKKSKGTTQGDESSESDTVPSRDECDLIFSRDLDEMLEEIRNNDDMEDVEKNEEETQLILRRLKCAERTIQRAELENKKVAKLSKEVDDMTNMIKSSMETADKKRSEIEDKMKAQGVDGKFLAAAQAKPEDML